MFYKIKFINKTGIHKTIIVCDSKRQTMLEENISLVNEDNYSFNNNIIHLDDTIENIKYKITKIGDLNVSIDELYIFAYKKKKYSTKEIYNILSQNRKFTITRSRFYNFLSNIDGIDLEKIPEKKEYDYKDILELKIEGKEINELTSLGIQYNLGNTYPFSVDPFKSIVEDELLKLKGDKIVSTHNKNILLDYGELTDNTIFVCLAEDMFSTSDSLYLIMLYYPYLAKDNINSLSMLLSEREKIKLKAKEKKVIDKYNTKIDYLYNIYNNSTTALKFKNKGISSVEFILHPSNNVLIPLNTLFRAIKTNKDRSLIKYNSSNKTEKLFRLFTDRISNNGKQIPILTKTKIQNISQTIGRKKSVSMYYEINRIMFVVIFYNNSEISVSINSINVDDVDEIKLFEKDELEEFIKSNLNVLLKEINIILGKSGYKYDFFETFNKRNIEIVNMTYKQEIKIDKKIDFEKYFKCFNNVFSIINMDLAKGIELDYKRISYYNKSNNLDRFISRMVQNKYNMNEIKILIKKNFEMSDSEIQLKLTEWLQSVQVEQNVFQNKKINIKNTSGIPIKIKKNAEERSMGKVENIITISIEQIDHILYLNTIPIFTEVLLRVSQNILDDTFILKDLKKICNDDISEITIQKDITPLPERTFEERKEIVLDKGEINFVDDDEDDDLLDILMGDDEDGDDIDFEDLGEIEVTPDSDTGGGSTNNEIDKLFGGVGGPKDQTTKKDPDDTEELIADIDGRSLNNPNYFFDRMYKKDPDLFLKQSDGKFQPYSRGCQWNYRRQPVILTDKEKEYIDKNHPDAYPKDHAFKYGSAPDKQFWYICPRYWCLKNNVPLTEQDVKDGKCGGKIIPYTAKTVPKGHYIFEFDAGSKNNEHIDSDGKYIQHYPGFLKPNFHPKGLGVPCCFRFWNKGGQPKRRELFLNEKSKSKSIKTGKSEQTTSKPKKEDFKETIHSITNFPLKNRTIGYLPISVQNMLGENYDLNKARPTDLFWKVERSGLLRRGVEYHDTQSFLACLAIYLKVVNRDECASKKSKSTNVTINDVKLFIKQKITLDLFIKLQNGSLVEIFFNEKNFKENNISEFKKSQRKGTFSIIDTMLEKKKKTKNENEIQNIDFYLKKIISAFKKFSIFIDDDKHVIDYTYLWDFVSNYMLEVPVNLIILDIVDDDLTNKLDIICPTSTYSKLTFDSKRMNIIIIKKMREKRIFYEPVCRYKYKECNNIEVMVMIRNMFSLNDGSENSNSELVASIKRIEEYQKQCIPTEKITYFKNTIHLKTDDNNGILDKISKNPNYTVDGQVLNYNNKIVGILVRNKLMPEISTIPIFIPITPSNIMDDIKIYTIDDDIWRDYSITTNILDKISNKEELDIPCDPMTKIVEDGQGGVRYVVGIITKTNQFVGINKPHPGINDDFIKISNINHTDYNKVDSDILFNDEIDHERETIIKKIKLETNFYAAFRNTIRNVINKLEHYDVKEEIKNIINTHGLFKNKLEDISAKLKDIVSPHITFVVFDDATIDFFSDIGLCVDQKTEDLDIAYCFIDEKTNIPQIKLPKTHLISGIDNEEIYFGKISDELIRYTKIRKYILEDNVYLNLTEIPFNLHSNEVVLPESLIMNEYFNNIKYSNTNYEVKNTYDTLLFDTNQNEIIKDKKKDTEIIKKEKEICQIKREQIRERHVSVFWKYFEQIKKTGEKCNMLTYEPNTNNCMFQIMLDIIKDKTSKNETIGSLKKIIIDEMVKMNKTNGEKLSLILKNQEKNYMFRPPMLQNYTLREKILNEKYYLTNIDIFILSKHFNIDIIIMSGSNLFNLIENNNKLATFNNGDSSYYYILRQVKIDKTSLQKYNLLGLNKTIRFSVDVLNPELQKRIKKYVFTDYL